MVLTGHLLLVSSFIYITCLPTVHTHTCICIIGGGKGGAVRLQPHLTLGVLHKILIFIIEIFSCKSISPTWFDCLPLLLPWYVYVCTYIICYIVATCLAYNTSAIMPLNNSGHHFMTSKYILCRTSWYTISKNQALQIS